MDCWVKWYINCKFDKCCKIVLLREPDEFMLPPSIHESDFPLQLCQYFWLKLTLSIFNLPLLSMIEEEHLFGDLKVMLFPFLVNCSYTKDVETSRLGIF